MSEKAFKIGASTDVRKLPEIVDWIKESHRDLELYTLAGLLEPAQDLRTVFKEVPGLLDGYQGRFGLHGPILSAQRPDSDLGRIILRMYREYLELCGELKATHMVIHSPFQSLGAPFPMLLTEAVFIRPMLAILKELIPLAEAINCTLVIENVFDTHPHMLRALVEACESDYVQMSLDTGHAYVMHRWGGGPMPDYWVREAGERLGHVHVQDTDGYTDRHWPPGQGHIGWYGFFQALRELPHEPRLVLEVADVMRGFHFLKDQGFVE